MATVYILGAGASKGLNDNAPLMPKLSQKVWQKILKSSEGDRLAKLKSFLEDFYPIYKDQVKYVDLESILSQVDISIVENRPLSSKYSVNILRELRNDLIYAICKVLQEELKHDGKYDEMCKLTDSFLKPLKRTDTIVSLNYDLIIDNRLSRDGKCVDYGIDTQRYSHDTKNTQPASPCKSSPKLYKLHGSLNWLYNPLLRTIDVTIGEKGVVRHIFESKPQLITPYEPVIITPSFIKDYTNPYIQQIWDGAEKAIREADNVAFIGYSLPDADMILRCMFKRAIFANQNSPEITVVGYWQEQKEQKTDLTRERYERLFGEIKDYHNDGFEKYINHI